MPVTLVDGDHAHAFVTGVEYARVPVLVLLAHALECGDRLRVVVDVDIDCLFIFRVGKCRDAELGVGRQVERAVALAIVPDRAGATASAIAGNEPDCDDVRAAALPIAAMLSCESVYIALPRMLVHWPITNVTPLRRPGVQ